MSSLLSPRSFASLQPEENKKEEEMVGIGDEQDNVIVVEHEVPTEPRSVNIIHFYKNTSTHSNFFWKVESNFFN